MLVKNPRSFQVMLTTYLIILFTAILSRREKKKILTYWRKLNTGENEWLYQSRNLIGDNKIEIAISNWQLE